jgi:hypothetical protein
MIFAVSGGGGWDGIDDENETKFESLEKPELRGMLEIVVLE